MLGFLPHGDHARARWPQAATLDLQRNLRSSLINMPRIPLKVVTSALNSYPLQIDLPNVVGALKRLITPLAYQWLGIRRTSPHVADPQA